MLAWKIALRYLISKKSHGAVNIISLISVIGVAIATMAIMIVLSVFNGFAELAASHLSKLDPEIRIVPAMGKVISNGDSLATQLTSLPYVDMAIPVVEERGLVLFGNEQMPIHFQGVPSGYDKFAEIDSAMVEGEYAEEIVGMNVAQISSGVAVKTGARTGLNNIISIYVPKRVGRINPASPQSSFMGQEFVVSGIFQIGQSEYDTDHVFIPIEQARELLQYDTESTSVDVKVSASQDIAKAVSMLKAQLGPQYRVMTRFEQQEEAFRMIEIEKWVTFLMLAFILVIASFNIISTLSLLIIEKRNNMETLRALGATKQLVRRVFVIEGWLISVLGGIVGIILGTLMSLVQEHLGLIKLSGDPTHLIIDVYPVSVEWTDMLIVMCLVMIVGLLTSQVTRLVNR